MHHLGSEIRRRKGAIHDVTYQLDHVEADAGETAEASAKRYRHIAAFQIQGGSALAITCQGEKDVLGLWIEQTEGAKFWLKVMNELKTRGVGDILIAVVDGLTGFPDATGQDL